MPLPKNARPAGKDDEEGRDFLMAYIEIYSKAWCPFCRMAKGLLQQKGYEFEEIDVEEDPAKYEEMLDRSGGAHRRVSGVAGAGIRGPTGRFALGKPGKQR